MTAVDRPATPEEIERIAKVLAGIALAAPGERWHGTPEQLAELVAARLPDVLVTFGRITHALSTLKHIYRVALRLRAGRVWLYAQAIRSPEEADAPPSVAPEEADAERVAQVLAEIAWLAPGEHWRGTRRELCAAVAERLGRDVDWHDLTGAHGVLLREHRVQFNHPRDSATVRLRVRRPSP
ncbi:hypothetical protein [Micromonospora globbae]|uniref:Uncharacterized protein n=1 Tax=Micromonospora globbae TaxID=1894969 RepID=A0A420EWZ0_9ACTN|nr:hypothetical protein [Micromonospora globbae]RKF25238.1 hypothetical protein D7I43_22555 [Micromonospora globbae]